MLNKHVMTGWTWTGQRHIANGTLHFRAACRRDAAGFSAIQLFAIVHLSKDCSTAGWHQWS
jgi:hypothetical protein